MDKKLIVGLGNPGEKFYQTRHNAGVFLIKQFQKNKNLQNFAFNKKINAQISENSNFILAIPQCYMNESGKVVRNLINYFSIQPNNLLIIHDDADLNIKDYKLQFNRGHAGHNGIKSILNYIKTQNFWRIRIGIRPEKFFNKLFNIRQKSGNFVLKKFSKKELEAIERLYQIIDEWINK